jgi:hypothetical protein
MMSNKSDVLVQWNEGGAPMYLSLPNSLLELGDMFRLGGAHEGRVIKLAGTNASGVKLFVQCTMPATFSIVMDPSETGHAAVGPPPKVITPPAPVPAPAPLLEAPPEDDNS